MNKIVSSSIAFASLLPSVVFAAAAPGQGLKALIDLVGDILGMLIPIAVSLALLYFIWGLAVFIKDSGNPEKKAEGQQKMLWGIIALFVIVSIWGLVGFIGETLGVDNEATVKVPQIPGVTS